MPNAPASKLNKLAGIPFSGAAVPLPPDHFGAAPVIGGFTLGNIWYVSSTHANCQDDTAHGGSPLIPMATIEYAIGRCTANNGDIIYVLPGHTETIPATDLNVDVAGIQIIGLGHGASRPTINLTATGSTIAVSAASVLFYNILVTGGIDNITTVLTLTAADFSMINCGYRDVTGQCAKFMTLSAAGNRCLITGFTYEGDVAAGTTRAFDITGCDRFILTNFRVIGNFSTSMIDVTTTAATNIYVNNGIAYTANAADTILVDTVTASTGTIGPNLYLRLTDNAANITEALTGATFVYHQPISIVNNAGEVGMNTNITATTDA